MLYLISSLQGLSAIEILAIALAYFIAICIALSVHEWAHAFVAYKCGDDTAKLAGRLTLNPIAHMSGWGLLCFAFIGFGWAKPVPINPSRFRSYRKHSILVILSGVLSNFILAFIFSGILYFLGGIIFAEYMINSSLLCLFLYYFLLFCVQINLILLIFNLLPIPPLDGFNLIAMLTKYGNKFVDFMNRYGFVVLLFMLLPFFNGSSMLTLFYNNALPLFLSYFSFFWGLFV
ncbi:MAG: site-2 protease family protein [Clostridia bacterium]|nr:site-2 protease family protein [Clostridia bacterium]